MKKIAFLFSLLLIGISTQGQTVTELRDKNNSEIKQLKKEYYKALQDQQDSRILSINEQRSNYIYKKFEDKRTRANELYRKDSVYRAKLKQAQQLNHQQYKADKIAELRNEIGYRRVSRAIDSIENIRKLKELEAQNKREAFYRSQQVKLEMLEQENELKDKINSRHDVLKNKYALPTNK